MERSNKLSRRRKPGVQGFANHYAEARCSRIELAVVALCILAGCSRSPYELAPVDGVVTIDGKPITDAKVMFAPIAQGENRNSGKPAFSELGPDGSFVLTTYHDRDGAVVEIHRVTILRLEADTQSGQAGRGRRIPLRLNPRLIDWPCREK